MGVLSLRFEDITFICCCCVWYLILLPVFMYYMAAYRKYSAAPFIRARNPRLALWSNYGLLILVFVIAPFQWAELLYLEAYQFRKYVLCEYVLFFRVIWEQLIMWLRLLRYWNLWYRHHHLTQCALSQYIEALNIDEAKSNYFVKHRGTLGDVTFLRCAIGSIWSLEVMILVVVQFIFDHHAAYLVIAIIGFLFYLFQCLLFLSLAVTINQIRDTLSIRTEVLSESLAAFASCVLFVAVLITPSVIDNTYFISFAMFMFPGFVCYPLMIGMSSIWVIWKMKEREKEEQNALALRRGNEREDDDDDNDDDEGSITKEVETQSDGGKLNMISFIPSLSTVHSITERARNFSFDRKLSGNSTASKASDRGGGTSHILSRFLPDKVGFELFAEHLIKLSARCVVVA